MKLLRENVKHMWLTFESGVAIPCLTIFGVSWWVERFPIIQIAPIVEQRWFMPTEHIKSHEIVRASSNGGLKIQQLLQDPGKTQKKEKHCVTSLTHSNESREFPGKIGTVTLNQYLPKHFHTQKTRINTEITMTTYFKMSIISQIWKTELCLKLSNPNTLSAFKIRLFTLNAI